MKFKIKRGVSRGVYTCGYNLLTARDENGKKVASQCGGGFDMWNSLVCQILTKTFQDELQLALKDTDLTNTGDGSHKFYCFHRDDKTGQIYVNGASGSRTTDKLLNLLGLEMKIDTSRKELTVERVA